MGCATLRFAATDFILMGLGHRSVVGQCDQIDGDASPAFAQAKPKVTRACGISAIPLSIGNTWTYEPAAPPPEMQRADPSPPT
jgi:hypothetical protein